MPRKQGSSTVSVDVPVLSAEATTAFDEWARQATLKSKAESKARAAKTAKDNAEKVIMGELGAKVDGRLPDGRRGTLAQLADGRRVLVAREERKQGPQDAREYGWWMITLTH